MSFRRTSFFHLAILAKRGHNRLFSSVLVSLALNNQKDSIPTSGCVQFADSPTAANPASLNLESHSKMHLLAEELFGETQASSVSFAWNFLVLKSIQTESRAGINDNTRTSHLAKYVAKEELAVLAPPRLYLLIVFVRYVGFHEHIIIMLSIV